MHFFVFSNKVIVGGHPYTMWPFFVNFVLPPPLDLPCPTQRKIVVITKNTLVEIGQNRERSGGRSFATFRHRHISIPSDLPFRANTSTGASAALFRSIHPRNML